MVIGGLAAEAAKSIGRCRVRSVIYGITGYFYLIGKYFYETKEIRTGRSML